MSVEYCCTGGMQGQMVADLVCKPHGKQLQVLTGEQSPLRALPHLSSNTTGRAAEVVHMEISVRQKVQAGSTDRPEDPNA